MRGSTAARIVQGAPIAVSLIAVIILLNAGFPGVPSAAKATLTGTRDPFLWPFASDSPWNMPVGTGAVFAVPAPTADWWGPGSGSGASYFNTSQPVEVWRASDTDLVRTLTVTHTAMPYADPQQSNFRTTVGPSSYRIRVPDNAHPTLPLTYPGKYTHDQYMHVLDPDGKTMHEFYLAYKATDGINWGSYDFYRYDITLDGYGKSPYGNSQPDGDKRVKHTGAAGGLQRFGGVLRKGELANGIKHALAIAVAGKMLSKNGPGGRTYTWPASASDPVDYYNTTGNVFMGSLLAIPSSVNLDSLGFRTPEGKAVAKALQLYGAYVMDTLGGAGNRMIFQVSADAVAEVPTQGGSNPFAMDLGLAVRNLRVVTNNGPNSVGGGGTPLAPLAPPFVSSTPR